MTKEKQIKLRSKMKYNLKKCCRLGSEGKVFGKEIRKCWRGK
jgi:hypothetical protein